MVRTSRQPLVSLRSLRLQLSGTLRASGPTLVSRLRGGCLGPVNPRLLVLPLGQTKHSSRKTIRLVCLATLPTHRSRPLGQPPLSPSVSRQPQGLHCLEQLRNQHLAALVSQLQQHHQLSGALRALGLLRVNQVISTSFHN